MPGLIALLFSFATPALASADYNFNCVSAVDVANVAYRALNVPLNAQFLLQHTYEAGADPIVELRDAADELVPVTIELGAQYLVVVPDGDLTPLGAYTLVSTNEDDQWEASFTAGEAIDTTAPAVPELLSHWRDRERHYLSVRSGVYVEMAAVPDAAHYEFEIAAAEDFSDAHRVARVSPNVMIGIDLCRANAPDYDHHTRYFMRARAVDLAGNASPWTTPEKASGGCSTIGSAGTWGGAFIGIMTLVGRRRVTPEPGPAQKQS